jgi:hypothetical protein
MPAKEAEKDERDKPTHALILRAFVVSSRPLES